MFLFEFDDNVEVQKVKLAAIVAQLQQDRDSGEIPEHFTVDELLDYLQKYDIILGVSDLYDMIKNPPLSTVISNIKGNQVIFKGDDDTEDTSIEDSDKEDKKKTVNKMAKSALGNLKNS